MANQLDLFTTNTEFNFVEMKSLLIENLDLLKEMTVQEQTLYKKWQEMNKGKKMSKIKKTLLTYKNELWTPTNLLDPTQTIKEIGELNPYVEEAPSGKEVTKWESSKLVGVHNSFL